MFIVANMFRCIPLFRGCNRQVEYIDKRHCTLANVPDEVLRYPRTLEELLLDSNHIRDLPKGLFRLVKLRRLSLSDNEIVKLPPEVASLVNLVELDISRNDIPDIPENVKFLKSLQSFDLSSNPLTKLPSGFVQLRSLAVLGLNDVVLSQLPNEFGNLQNLQSLELRENLLRSLPPSFAMLTKLERLDLGSNEISELPPLIGQLVSLQELWLDCNDLYKLPAEIGFLKKLTCLDVSENRLESIPDEIGGLESLTDLHLSQNCLETLPDGIGKLSRLTIFKVDQNRLLSLTPEIGNCESLQELILTENLLSELPLSIGKLVNLTNLNVDRNRLSELPPQIGNLTRLGVLSLRENRLNFLPDETGKLKELHVLDVSGNRLQYLPITITALNLKALWLAENQSQPMLKFQTDINERTGAKVLTCFLLPQQEYHPESMENLLRDSIEQDSRLSWEQKGERTSSVKFVEEPQEDKEDKETQFVRHDTPHPRELKARHNKLLVSKAKNIDGHVVAHEEKETTPVDSFRPQRSSITSVTSSSSETSATQFKDAVQSLADIPDSDDLQENSNFPEEEAPVPSNDANRPLYRAQTKEDLLDEDSVNEAAEKEEEKHVIFDAEVEDDEQPERHNKLHRRDTPHHLKNKRINIVDSQKDQEKVLAILAQEAKKDVSDDTTSQQSMPSSQVSVVSDADKTETLSGENSRPTSVEHLEVQLEFLVQKTTAGLGLSIAGGVGSTPYKGDDEGIFVSKVISGGPAEKAGLKVGDKIVQVNGKCLEGATHYDAVDTLKTAGNDMSVIIRREASKPKDVLDNEEPIYENQRSLLTSNTTDAATEKVQMNHVETARSPEIQKKQDVQVVLRNKENEIPPVSSERTLNTDTAKKNVSEICAVSIGKTSVVDDSNSAISVQSNKENVPEQSGKDSPQKNSEPVYKSKKPENLTIKPPNDFNEDLPINNLSADKSEKKEQVEYDIKYEIFHTTLIREQNGLGISIAGNPPGEVVGDVNEGIYITKISENGAAAKDGKLKVGDKVLTINGVDMEGARQDQAVSLLSGLDRYVRLVVQRQKLVPRDPNAPHLPEKTPLSSSQSLFAQKSPRLIGLPRPYTQKFYSSGSYMANRPSYMGSYKRPEISPASTDTKTFSLYTKLPGLRNNPLDVESVSNSLTKQPSEIVCNSVQTKENIENMQNSLMNKKQSEKISSAYTEMNCVNHIDHSENVEVISLVKAGGPLGLSIIGGVDHTCHPFGADDPGIFISKIVPDGAAAKTGKLRVGDRLMKVNGADVHNATHRDAVMALLAPTYEMHLTIRHDPLPKGWQEIMIIKHSTEKLGMGIQGGVGGQPGNPYDKDDEGIFISWVNEDGAAGADGRIYPGMRIVEVNETSLLGATYQEAITALRLACDTVRLIVCDGYNNRVNEEDDDDDSEYKQEMKPSISSSSIDKVDELTHVFRQEQEVIKETAEWEKEDLDKMERLKNQQGGASPQQDKSPCAEDLVNTMTEYAIKPSQNTDDHVALSQVPVSTPLKNTSFEKDINGMNIGSFDDDLKSPPSPIYHMSKEIDISAVDITVSTDESLVDPIGKSKLPGAKVPPQKAPKNVVPSMDDPEQLTFSEKKRKFEQVAKHVDKGAPEADAKQFSFFTEQELERMREEEEKKLSSMTAEEIKVYHSVDYDDDPENCDDFIENQNTSPNVIGIPILRTSPPSGSKIPVRTAKAENRLQIQFQDEIVPDVCQSELTPAQQRALQAAKRAAWRQARLKSLEADALKAQLVIAKAKEISQSRSCSSDGVAEDIGYISSDRDDSSNMKSAEEDDGDELEVSSPPHDIKEAFIENGIGGDDDDGDADVSLQETASSSTKLSSKRKKRRPKKR